LNIHLCRPKGPAKALTGLFMTSAVRVISGKPGLRTSRMVIAFVKGSQRFTHWLLFSKRHHLPCTNLCVRSTLSWGTSPRLVLPLSEIVIFLLLGFTCQSARRYVSALALSRCQQAARPCECHTILEQVWPSTGMFFSMLVFLGAACSTREQVLMILCINKTKLDAGVRFNDYVVTFGDRPNDYESVTKCMWIWSILKISSLNDIPCRSPE
jgi:hypothetical protein